MPYRQVSRPVEISKSFSLGDLSFTISNLIDKGRISLYSISFGNNGGIDFGYQVLGKTLEGRRALTFVNPIILADIELALDQEQAQVFLNNFPLDLIKIQRKVPDEDISYVVKRSRFEAKTDANDTAAESVRRVEEMLEVNIAEPGQRNAIWTQLREAKERGLELALKGKTSANPDLMKKKYHKAFGMEIEEDDKPPERRDYSEPLQIYLDIIRQLPCGDEKRTNFHKLTVLNPHISDQFTADGYRLSRVSDEKTRDRVYEESRLIAEDAVENLGFDPGKFASEESCIKYVCTPERVVDRKELVETMFFALESSEDAVELEGPRYVLTVKNSGEQIRIKGRVMDQQGGNFSAAMAHILHPLGQLNLDEIIQEYPVYYRSELSLRIAKGWDSFTESTGKIGASVSGGFGVMLGGIGASLAVVGGGIGAGVGFTYSNTLGRFVERRREKADEKRKLRKLEEAEREMEKQEKERIIKESLTGLGIQQNVGNEGCVILVDPECEAKLNKGEFHPEKRAEQNN